MSLVYDMYIIIDHHMIRLYSCLKYRKVKQISRQIQMHIQAIDNKKLRDKREKEQANKKYAVPDPEN